MAHVVITENATREQSVLGAGGTLTTSITFEFFEDDGSDVDVYIDAVLQTDPTNYSIAPTAGTDGGYAGGTINWVSSQASVTVTAELALAFTRSTDFPISGSFNITTLNTQLDKLWSGLKQLNARLGLESGIFTHDTLNATDDVKWPLKAARASKYAGWDGDGKLAALVAPLTGQTATAFMATVLDDASAEAARKTLLFAKGADVSSDGTLALGTDGNYFDITGTTTIVTIDTWNVGDIARLHFDGILTLTHHATDLILPGAADIVTAAGDEAMFVEYASGDWRCIHYQRAANIPAKNQNWIQGADVSSASPCVLGTDGNYFDVTGTTGFSAFTVAAGVFFMVQFDGALVLTHGASIDLPGEANITTAAGDRLIGFATAANVVQVLSYTRASGQPATISGEEFVSSTAIAAATTVEVTGLEAGYDYSITLDGVSPTDDGETFLMQLSDDNGSTYEADSGDYEYQHDGGGTVTRGTNVTAVKLSGALTIANDAGFTGHWKIELINPGGTAEAASFIWNGLHFNVDATPLVINNEGSGHFAGGAAALNAIKFYWSGGSTFQAIGNAIVRRKRRA
jgi:hypothetical protein